MIIEVSSPPEYASTAFFTCRFMVILQNRYQYSLLGGQAICSLLECQGTFRIHNSVGHFKAAVGRQTMHEISGFTGPGKKCLIHLVWPEYLGALLELVFLSHAGPNVGVNCVRTLNRINLGKPRHILAFCWAIPLGADRPEG